MFKDTEEGRTHHYNDDCCFTHGQMDAYAIENVEVERTRIHSAISLILARKETLTQEDLSKIIFGNKK
jgi:hypothetical protein